MSATLPPSQGDKTLELETPMKTILLFSLLLWVIAMPAIGALDDADLDKIRLIVNASEKRIRTEVKTEITAIKQELKAESAESEKRMIAYIDIRISALDKRLSARIDMLLVFLIGILALIAVAIGVPAWQNMKYNALQNQIETLTQEIETLKQQRIVQP